MQSLTKSKPIQHFQINDTVFVKGKLNAFLSTCEGECEIEHDYNYEKATIHKVTYKNDNYYYDISSYFGGDTDIIANNVPQSYLYHSVSKANFKVGDKVYVNGEFNYFIEGLKREHVGNFSNDLTWYTVDKIIQKDDGIYKYNIRNPNMPIYNILLDIEEMYLEKIKN